MISWRKHLIPAIAMASLLIASGTMPQVISRAEEAILIPGATVLKPINPFYSIFAENYPKIGVNFHDDEKPHLVGYSQDALNSDRALADGVKQTMIALQQTDGKVVIIGESMGSMVAARVAKELAAQPQPRSTDDVRVVLIAPPEAGVAEYFKEGTFIPILNYRVKRVATSPYPTTIVIGEYDGFADPPDRPWNVLATANALLGIVYVHGAPIAATDPDDVPPANVTTIPGNKDHGPITTMLVPTKNLPLTQFFRDLGVPDELVDKFDAVLRPVIDSAYARHDQPGDTRPYLQDGEIRRNVQSQQEDRQWAGEVSIAGDRETTDVDATRDDAGGDDDVVTGDVPTGDAETTQTDTRGSDARDGGKSEAKKTPRQARRAHVNEQREVIRNGVKDLQNRINSSLDDLRKKLTGPQAQKEKSTTETETETEAGAGTEAEPE